MTSYCPTCRRHINGAVCCPGCGVLAAGLPQVPDLPPARTGAGPRHRAVPGRQAAARERRRLRLTLATAAVGLLAAGVVGASGAPQTTRTGDLLADGGVQSLRPDGPRSVTPFLVPSLPSAPAAAQGGLPSTAAAAVASSAAGSASVAAVPAPDVSSATAASPDAPSAVPMASPPPPGPTPPAVSLPSAPTSTGTGTVRVTRPPATPTTTAAPSHATPTSAPPPPATASAQPSPSSVSSEPPACALRLLVICLG